MVHDVSTQIKKGKLVRSREDTNFGFGLYIAQMIANKHHGYMTVQNRVQGGAYTKMVIKALT